jgi:hypothetical protein
MPGRFVPTEKGEQGWLPVANLKRAEEKQQKNQGCQLNQQP